MRFLRSRVALLGMQGGRERGRWPIYPATPRADAGRRKSGVDLRATPEPKPPNVRVPSMRHLNRIRKTLIYTALITFGTCYFKTL